MEDKVKVSCLRCGATNLFPLASAGKKVICGRCKSSLPDPGKVLELSPEMLGSFFAQSGLPILLDFYSTTCAPCHMMHPILERLARRRAGELMAVKINIDQYPQIAAQFGIQAVPTFIVLIKGQERGRSTGAMPEADFSLWVASRT
jgi:thioredoxin 2